MPVCVSLCVCWSTPFHSFNQVWAVKMTPNVPIDLMVEQLFSYLRGKYHPKSARGNNICPNPVISL